MPEAFFYAKAKPVSRETGEHEFGVSVNVVWFQVVVKGNLKIRNTKTDED